MSSNNQKITLNTYENNIDNYIEGTPNEVIDGWHKEYLDKIISIISSGAKILEIGSAVGRDADYFENMGYKVLRTDIVQGFINYQKGKGKEVSKFNIIDGALENKFDVILAFAVFLHFDEEQFIQALLNTKNHLKDNGLFALSLKNGEGQEYSSHKMNGERFFKYWKPEELKGILESNGFEVKYLNVVADNKWIHCIAELK